MQPFPPRLRALEELLARECIADVVTTGRHLELKQDYVAFCVAGYVVVCVCEKSRYEIVYHAYVCCMASVA